MKASTKAKIKYNKEHYYRITVTFPKAQEVDIRQSVVDLKLNSVNELIKVSVAEYIKNNK